MDNKQDKIWYASKESMVNAIGDCDYMYLPNPADSETHFRSGEVMAQYNEEGMPHEEREGCEYFFTVGEYVPDEVAKKGIYIPLEAFERRQQELFGDETDDE